MRHNLKVAWSGLKKTDIENDGNRKLGQLVDGIWQPKDLPRVNARGEFVRNESDFRSEVGSQEFPAQSGRYHLFVNSGCPWAYRTILYRSLKNLQDTIGISYTQPAIGEQGWTFAQPESLLGATHLHDVYAASDKHFTGRCTVPVLWDKQTHSIVNNESAQIIRMLNTAFDALPGTEKTDYYPEPMRAQIDTLNEEIYTNVNNGVYLCGFAHSQEAYDCAFDDLFRMLDKLDNRLANQRYLCGEQVTEADWRLFATLVRFDIAYYGQFKCNKQMLKDYPNLWPYCRDLYQLPRVQETVDFQAIKSIYYGSIGQRLLPKGPLIDFSQPHHRDWLLRLDIF